MILVTVGMHTQPFDRLVQAADELASRVSEEVVIQRGCASYAPQYSRSVDYVDEGQMGRWMAAARIVISHGGAGVILGALLAGKPLVVAPRLCDYGEHFDDHQLELAEALAKQRQAVVIKTDLSAKSLEEACKRAMHLDCARVTETGLQRKLRDWLAEQVARSTARGWGPLFRWRRGQS